MESSEQQMPAAEMERMMKAQEVILKAAAGKLKWWEAAECGPQKCDRAVKSIE